MKLSYIGLLALAGWTSTAFFLTIGTLNMLHEGNLFGTVMLIATISFWVMSVSVFIGKKIYERDHDEGDQEDY